MIADVRIGPGYTAVILNDGNVGVAYTFRETAATGCSAFMGDILGVRKVNVRL
jgi:Putative heavy-metal chelation